MFSALIGGAIGFVAKGTAKAAAVGALIGVGVAAVSSIIVAATMTKTVREFDKQYFEQ